MNPIEKNRITITITTEADQMRSRGAVVEMLLRAAHSGTPMPQKYAHSDTPVALESHLSDTPVCTDAAHSDTLVAQESHGDVKSSGDVLMRLSAMY